MVELPLFGREHELATLEDLVDRVGQRGRTLVVGGEAGIGKSTLLAAAATHARDHGMLVLTAAGVQSEAHLPFAGLHQMLRPILDRADDLPARQRDALLAAFGMADAAAPDLFLIALAVLELFADTAAGTPLLLCVEDAQWLDRPSGDVLAFVARRLESEPIVLLAAIREGYASPLVEAGLPELCLDGLDQAEAGALLDAHEPKLSPVVRQRLLDEAAGNPLALIELAAALEADQLGEAALLPVQLPLTARLERALAARMSELPAATRTLLLVAAVDDGGVLAEVLAATATIDRAGTGVDALAPAVDARLVEVDEMELRFRHPLVRSAVQQAANVSERQVAHAALAGVLVGQPDRRAWHRAAASMGPDEEAADALEQVAARTQRRGAMAVAVAALEQAARLSADSSRRGGRLLRAAELAFELGRPDLVERLLQQVEPLELAPVDQTRRMWLREMSEEGVADGPARVRSLVEIADRTRQDGDAELAMNFLRAAALRCWWDDPGKEVRDGVVAAAQRMPVSDDNPELIAILALADPVRWGAVFLDRLPRLAADAGGDPRVAWLLGAVATAVGAFDRSGGLLAVSVAGLRAQGRLGVLAQALVSQAFTAIHTGDWKVALPAAEEASRLAAETAQPRWLAGAHIAQATLAGLRGDEDAADTLAAEAEQLILPMASNSLMTLLQIARGLTALGSGRHDDAYQQLRRVFDPTDLAYHPFVRGWAVGELAEAALHSGHRDAVRSVLADLEPLADQTPSPLLHVGLLSARPLLADDQDAEPLFQAGLDADLARWPLVRARLLLAYGAWLRRQRRVAESRVPLRAAREAFDALGAIPWGERARQELRASGENSEPRTAGAWDRLSPQELQIAHLAAAGLSNREIGQQLYLSHRTVGTHLYRAFPKLGITSRSELRSVLGGEVGSPR